MLILVVSALLPKGRSFSESDSALVHSMLFTRVSPGLQEYFWTDRAFGVSCRDVKKVINQSNAEFITFC